MPGADILGLWNVAWADGDSGIYDIHLHDGEVHMSVRNCMSREESTCASQQDVVVTRSTNNKYLGWVQASNVHGGDVTVYMKKNGTQLSLVWLRPSGYQISGIGTKIGK